MRRRIYNEMINLVYGLFFEDVLMHIQKNNVFCTGAKRITTITAHTQSFMTHYRKTRDFYRFFTEISNCYCEIITVNKCPKIGEINLCLF